MLYQKLLVKKLGMRKRRIHGGTFIVIWVSSKKILMEETYRDDFKTPTVATCQLLHKFKSGEFASLVRGVLADGGPIEPIIDWLEENPKCDPSLFTILKFLWERD